MRVALREIGAETIDEGYVPFTDESGTLILLTDGRTDQATQQMMSKLHGGRMLELWHISRHPELIRVYHLITQLAREKMQTSFDAGFHNLQRENVMVTIESRLREEFPTLLD